MAFDSVPLPPPADSTHGMPAFAIRSIRDIAQGQELFLSYVNAGDNGEARRKHLREHYGFDCCCARCSGEADAAFVPPPRCKHEQCGTGYVAGGACMHCGRAG